MLSPSDIIAIIAALIAFSSWVTLLYNWITSKPKINGRIFNVITGRFPNPANSTETLTSFNIYLYLTNTRKNSVHMIDYELEIDRGSGYEKMLRIYGAHKIPNWTFTGDNDQPANIPNYPDKLLTKPPTKAVEFGKPLHGFLLFATRKPQDQFLEQVKKYKVTCVDVFGRKHEIVSCPKQFLGIHLLEELAEIDLGPIPRL